MQVLLSQAALFLDVVSGHLIITNQQSTDSVEFVARDCKETFFMTPHKEKKQLAVQG